MRNPELPVKRDIFHALQDIFRSCKAGPERQVYMAAVSNCFYSNDLGDQRAVEEEYIAKGWTLDEIKKMPLKWWQDKRRRYVLNPDRIVTKLNALFMEYMPKNIFKDDMLITHAQIISQLQSGWYHDPEGVDMHYRTTPDDQPARYITSRSTSQLEAFHRTLRDVFSSTMSNVLMHLLLMFHMFDWNLKKSRNHRGSKALAVLDAQLQNDVRQLYVDMNVDEALLPQSIRDWSLLKPAWPLVEGPEPDFHETFGIIRFKYQSEAFQVSQEVCSTVLCTFQSLTTKGYASYDAESTQYICTTT